MNKLSGVENLYLIYTEENMNKYFHNNFLSTDFTFILKTHFIYLSVINVVFIIFENLCHLNKHSF